MKSSAAFLLGLFITSSTFVVFGAPASAGNASTPTATNSPDGAASPASHPYFVSPITALKYQILDGLTAGTSNYRLGDVTYASIESILNHEVAQFPGGLYKIEPALRSDDGSAEPDGRLPVLIFLTEQFGREVSTRIQESSMQDLQNLWHQRTILFDRMMSTNIKGPLSPEAGSIDSATVVQFRRVDAEYSSAISEMRGQIYAETEKLNLPVQEPLVARITTLGGLVMYRGPFVDVITARLSQAGLRELVKDPLVGSVFRDGIMTARLDISVPSIGAPDWWAAGFNTPTYKIVVSDTGIDKTHPALVGKITDEKVFHDEAQLAPNYNDDPTNPDDLQGHGTHVAGIVGSQDSTYRGVAYGLKGIVNAKFGYLTTGGGGQGTWGDAMKALDWAFGTAGASVGTFSFGDSTPGNGNGGFSRFLDAVVDDLGIPYSIAAGNDGPGSGTLGQPADAFNILAVGAMNDLGTTSRTTDVIADFSSRGPTTDGRIKPDIVAPGEDSSNPGFGIYSCNYKWETQNDFIDYPGTSMASPHVGGSLVLLLNYLGPRGFFPAVPKALLLENAEDKGAVGPDNDYGWGYIDLTSTLANKDKVYNDTVKPSQPKFYLGTWAANDRATLVWQKHVTYKGAAYPSVYYSLNNLDLFLYNGPANSLATSSTSGIDNVEQTRYPGALATAVLKVKPIGSLNGVTAEPFAVATLKPFTLAKPPTFQVTWQGPTNVEVGNVFSLTANVTNVGDLTAFGAVGTLTVPGGLTLLTGSNPVLLGDIAAGATKSTTWSFQGNTVGNKTLSLAIASNAYGENFNGVSNYTLRIMDSFPPIINGAWAQPSPQNAGLKVNITADITDNLAVFAAYSNVVGPLGPVGNFSMAKHPVSGLWFVDRPYYVAGHYDATVWATDMDRWTSAPTQFDVVDTTPPSILAHSAQPNPQQIHGDVNVTAQIWDQAGISGAWVEITDPLSAKTNNTLSSMGSSYWFQRQYDILGAYGYRVSAADPTGNWKVGTGSFDIVDTIPPTIVAVSAQPNPQIVFFSVNITATISDLGGVTGAWVEIADPLGGKVNRTMAATGGSYWLEQPYGVLGDYSFRISAVDIVNQWSTANGSFRIIDPFQPIPNAGPDQIVPWNTTVDFDGSASMDNFGISSYTWNFTDGGPVTLTGVRPSYGFTNLGTYVVTLTVEDFSSNRASDTMIVTVIDVTKPEILSHAATPSLQNPGDQVEIRATVTDNIAVAGVWVDVWDPLAIRTNYSMPNVGGNDFAFTQSYTLIGIYMYEVWAVDTSGNWNHTTGPFEIRDMIRPSIMSVNAQPDPQEVLFVVQITSWIQDNIGVTGVWVEVTRPGGGLAGNFTMTFDSMLGVYRNGYTTDALGIHTYVVSARDQAGNWNTSAGQFLVQDTVPPTVQPTNSNVRNEVDTPFNFTAFASDNFGFDKVHAEIISPTGDNLGNFTMNFVAGMGSTHYLVLNFSDLGDYQIHLSVNDFGGNWGTSSATATIVDTQLPHANAGPDQTLKEGNLVNFDGSGSWDSHGISSFTWTFIENSSTVTLLGPRPSHTFIKSGTYAVTLVVADYAGNLDSDVMTVFVQKDTTGGNGGGGGGGGGGNNNLWDAILNDLFIGRFWIVPLIVAAIAGMIIAAVLRRRSKHEKMQKARAAARVRAMRAAEAGQQSLPPPPEEEQAAPTAAEEPVETEPVSPPPPEDEIPTRPSVPPPPPEDP